MGRGNAPWALRGQPKLGAEWGETFSLTGSQEARAWKRCDRTEEAGCGSEGLGGSGSVGSGVGQWRVGGGCILSALVRH